MSEAVSFRSTGLLLLFNVFPIWGYYNAFKIKVKQSYRGFSRQSHLPPSQEWPLAVRSSTVKLGLLVFRVQSDWTSITSFLGNLVNQSLHNCLCPLLESSHFWGQARQLLLPHSNTSQQRGRTAKKNNILKLNCPGEGERPGQKIIVYRLALKEKTVNF